MVSVDENNINETQLLVVTENGYGKRTKLEDEGEAVYRITNRGGKGVKTLNITEKTGALVSINTVTDADDLMIINKSGLTIRMDVSTLRVMGRATQGVRLINLKGNDSIAAVTKVMKDDEEEAMAIDGEELEVDPNAILEDDSDDDDVVDNDDDASDEENDSEE